MQLLGIAAGSLRRDSSNRKLLGQASALLPQGVTLVEWNRLGAVPPFSEDDESEPAPAVQPLRQAIAAADAVLLVTPEYNASIPGQLKNALAWASRPFPDNVLRDKPVAVVSASPSPGGGARALADTRKVLRAIGARVIDAELPVARVYEQLDAKDRLVDPGLRGRLFDLLRELSTTIRARTDVAAA